MIQLSAIVHSIGELSDKLLYNQTSVVLQSHKIFIAYTHVHARVSNSSIALTLTFGSLPLIALVKTITAVMDWRQTVSLPHDRVPLVGVCGWLALSLLISAWCACEAKCFLMILLFLFCLFVSLLLCIPMWVSHMINSQSLNQSCIYISSCYELMRTTNWPGKDHWKIYLWHAGRIASLQP